MRLIAAGAFAAPAVAAFLASLVEAVEALTVLLAVGAVCGWRRALAGASAGLLCIVLAAAALGPALSRLPLGAIRLAFGLLLFGLGLQWLIKACLREAGRLGRHDENAAFVAQQRRLQDQARKGTRLASDGLAGVVASFQATFIEGAEIAFVVASLAAADGRALLPAGIGAVAALLFTALLALFLRRPLSMIPENIAKLVAGVLLTSSGMLSVGEQIGLRWPARFWAAPALAALIGVLALGCIEALRATRQATPIGMVARSSRLFAGRSAGNTVGRRDD